MCVIESQQFNVLLLQISNFPNCGSPLTVYSHFMDLPKDIKSNFQAKEMIIFCIPLCRTVLSF